MRRFANALSDALKELGWSPTDLARRTGKRQSSVTDWVNEESYRPTIPVLEALLKVLPADQATNVLIAHLHDQIPEEARKLVTVEPRSKQVKEEMNILEGLPRREREVLTWTANQLSHNDNLRDLLEINRKLIGG